jgi:hypothetical protein
MSLESVAPGDRGAVPFTGSQLLAHIADRP